MELVKAPDKRLRIKTKPVKKITPQLIKTTKDMIKLTKTFVEPEGVGLASTQVGLKEQLFVAKQNDGTFKSYFNPKILKGSKKTKVMFEGCLSIPNFWGEVSRFVSVTVSYLNEKGEEAKERLTGLPAHIFQHEYDHLQGILFIDHVMTNSGKLYKITGKDRTGTDIFEEVENT